MSAKFDNFFMTTLVDRTTRKYSRVRDMVNGSNSTRITWDGDLSAAELDELPFTGMYAYIGTTGDTITLSDRLCEQGTPEAPYKIIIFDEGGNADNQAINVNGGSKTIDQDPGDVSMNDRYGNLTLYSTGTEWFSL